MTPGDSGAQSGRDSMSRPPQPRQRKRRAAAGTGQSGPRAAIRGPTGSDRLRLHPLHQTNRRRPSCLR